MPRKAIQKMTVEVLPDGGVITLRGRNAWMLRKLMEAGKTGLTSIEAPAPRNSHYVHELRKAGISIVTEDEAHNGPYPGVHGRYFLRSEVKILSSTEDRV